jgi:two-component system LytT family response regulator
MIKTILVDDDDSNLKTLIGLLKQYCKNVQILATSKTIREAEIAIIKHNPELVFLDVEMQNETGFDLFTLFPTPNFEVIFTTAHEQYALKAIKSSCLEYLLKPIDYRELVGSVEKFENSKQLTKSQNRIETLIENTQNKEKTLSKIAIPSADGYTFLNTSEIQFCEADMNYTKVVTNNGESFLSTKNLKEFEELLSPLNFFRCHKSWLINLNFVKKYSRTDGNRVQMANDKWIDISFRKKDEFLKIFTKNSNSF